MIWARQQKAASAPVLEPWWSLGFGAVALIELGERLSLMGEAEVSTPITQPQFVLSDGSEVYRVGAGARAALGAPFLFDPE